MVPVMFFRMNGTAMAPQVKVPLSGWCGFGKVLVVYDEKGLSAAGATGHGLADT